MNHPLAHARGQLPGGLCYWCGRQMTPPRRGRTPSQNMDATRDHIEPECKGGTRTVWACFCCNQQKADMTLDEWRAFMAMFPEWWRLFDTPKARGRALSHFRRKLGAGDVTALPAALAEQQRRIRAGRDGMGVN